VIDAPMHIGLLLIAVYRSTGDFDITIDVKA